MESHETTPSTTNSSQWPSMFSASGLARDFAAGLVVFLVALPLCLGIALASKPDGTEIPNFLMSGVISGIIGGVVVGLLSGSHASVSGPAAGLTAIVATQIATLGSFEAFLLAVLLSGAFQVALGFAKAGALSAFFPSSVIKGLLAAIGLILILKQFPHLCGDDNDFEGEMSFFQPDDHNTFSELWITLAGNMHQGALLVGVISIVVLVVWSRTKFLKNSLVPAPLVVALGGVAMQLILRRWGGDWVIEESHLVTINVATSSADLLGFFNHPDFHQWNNPAIYVAAVTIAVVASLETLINLEATDRLDPRRRTSAPNRELMAQGVGNMVAGLVGGLPMTSVIVRSSVNLNAGANSKLSAVIHGLILIACVAVFPVYVNMIPLSALAAILIFTGFKLASPALFKQMWNEGRYQFLPFIITLVTIVFTDLLVGILVGLAVSVLFILNSNLRRPLDRRMETHLGGEVLHISLPNQVSFLNRAALSEVLNSTPRGSQLLIDASQTDYIDPDVLGILREYRSSVAPTRGVSVSMRGFKHKYDLANNIQYVNYATRELKDRATPEQILEILRSGNKRFQAGKSITRDFNRLVDATAQGQNPLAVVLSCIDSRVPAELILDLGIGDIYSVRVAGNVIGTKTLGSIEYGVNVAGTKLVLVLGHTRCGAVASAMEFIGSEQNVSDATGCPNLPAIVDEIAGSVKPDQCRKLKDLVAQERDTLINDAARRNVLHVVQDIPRRSESLRRAIEAEKVMVVGALYDVTTGAIEFYTDQALPNPIREPNPNPLTSPSPA